MHCLSAVPAVSDLTGLVDLLKDWMNFHQSLAGLPEPVLDRQSIQPVRYTHMLCLQSTVTLLAQCSAFHAPMP